MKKLIVLLAFLSTGFIACTKDNDRSCTETEKLTVENAAVVAAGDLFFYAKANTGVAKVYRQTGGKYILGLEQMNLDAGTSLVIYLSGSKTVSAAAIKIFSTPGLHGNVLHLLPSDIDFVMYKHVIIQTEPSEEIIASAELK